MSILEKEVYVTLHSKTISWYEKKGYPIPREKNSRGKSIVPRGSKILVKIEDLTRGSDTRITKVCDICGDHIINQKYSLVIRELECGNGRNYCCACGKRKSGDKKKISFDFIKSEFEKHGYIIKDEEYINAKEKIKYLCSAHEEKGVQYLTWDEFSNKKRRCLYCSGTNRPTFEEIVFEFEKRNYILSEDQYNTAKTKMKYICIKHKEQGFQKISWDKFKMGRGCRFCGEEKTSGENHWNWKGGITKLNDYLRNKIDLWKNKSLYYSGYKCVITGKSVELVVHHIVSFNTIVSEVLKNLNLPIYETIESYTSDELNKIEIECVKIHQKYGLGVCLHKEVHNLFHRLYGKGDNTEAQFEEFKKRYKCGEFNF